MDDLETRLRSSLLRQVTGTPELLDLTDTVVRRGRGVRRRRALAASLAVAGVTVASVVLVGAVDGPARRVVQPASTPTSEPSPSAQDPHPVAPQAWVDGLAHDPASRLATPVVVGDVVLFPGLKQPVTGVRGQVFAATAVSGGLLVSSAVPNEGPGRLSVVATAGSLRQLDGDAEYGHAVDPTGRKVAYGSRTGPENLVADVATGKVLARTTLANEHFAGTPVGWVGDEVLMTVGDGAEVYAKAWNTRTGAVRVIGTAGDYWGAYATAGKGDLVAMRQGDGGCVALSYLHQAGDLWARCDGSWVGFSPDGRRVLLGQALGTPGEAATVYDGVSGAALLTRPALPREGVLAVGWSGDDTIAAVVRVPGSGGSAAVLVVTCPTTGEGCTAHERRADVETAWVVNARG